MAGEAQAETTGDGIDAVAAAIAKKLGGDAPPERTRNEQGRFVAKDEDEPQDDVTPTPESGEPEEGEADEGVPPEDVEDLSDEGDEKPQTYTVKVDGQDESVTLEELVSGYSKDAAYRRKTQALAEKERAWEATREQTLKAERDALVEEREQAKTVLTQWTGMLQQQLGNKEYWDKLYQENPGKWAADRQVMTEQFHALQKQSEELQQKTAKETEADMAKARQAEYLKLIEVQPEWKDTAKLTEGFAKMGDYATKVRGFKPEELGTIVDHRIWLVINDAAAFHALKEKKPTIAPKLAAVKTVTPGAAPAQNTNATRLNKLAARVQKTGRTEDLAAMLKHKFAKPGRSP